MKTFLNIYLFLSCLFVSAMARPQSIFDDVFVPVPNQQGSQQQQDNPFLPQRPADRPSNRPSNRPADRPANPFFPTNGPTTPPTVTTTTVRTRTTASPQYLACMGSCPSTSQYNPVCGSDNINYHNGARLECAKFCGKSVAVVRAGTCAAL